MQRSLQRETLGAVPLVESQARKISKLVPAASRHIRYRLSFRAARPECSQTWLSPIIVREKIVCLVLVGLWGACQLLTVVPGQWLRTVSEGESTTIQTTVSVLTVRG